MNIIEKSKHYAISCHNNTNHLYDGKPYVTHLYMVFEQAKKYSYLVPIEDRDNFLASAYIHDVIEDCRQTYNDVLNATNKHIAELCYALTNEKGKNRKERANKKYYDDMKKTPYAVLLKICDRIANLKYSIQTKSSMVDVYIKENDNFILSIYDITYKDAFDDLGELCNKKI